MLPDSDTEYGIYRWMETIKLTKLPLFPHQGHYSGKKRYGSSRVDGDGSNSDRLRGVGNNNNYCTWSK